MTCEIQRKHISVSSRVSGSKQLRAAFGLLYLYRTCGAHVGSIMSGTNLAQEWQRYKASKANSHVQFELDKQAEQTSFEQSHMGHELARETNAVRMC